MNMCDGGGHKDPKCPLNSNIYCHTFFPKLLLKKFKAYILDLFSEEPFLIRMEAVDSTFHLSRGCSLLKFKFPRVHHGSDLS